MIRYSVRKSLCKRIGILVHFANMRNFLVKSKQFIAKKQRTVAFSQIFFSDFQNPMILEDFHGFSIFWSNQSQASLKNCYFTLLHHLAI